MLAEPSVEAIVLNFRDIHDRKIAEEKLAQLAQSLEKRVEERTSELTAANKELEAFAYTVSHDLRAPVRAIGGFTKILQQEHLAGLDEEGQRVFRVIIENTNRMERLIEDLLSFSRLSRAELNLMAVNMREMVLQCFDDLTTPEIRQKIMLSVDEIPPSRGDASMLKQVWTNLVSNAIKYSSNRNRPEIRVSGYMLDGEFVYTIEDNGIGFNMLYVEKLFGVFQRLHSLKEYEGTGVGLAIVQRVIHRHGGKIWAEGVSDKGAKFSFILKPAQPRPAATRSLNS
jgi:light-regulated signal transduction histidine kinase (bacteriophytochrome)